MRLYLHHGRLDPTTGGTDEAGVETGDWGFDGPDLQGVIGFHATYFPGNDMNVFFESKEAAQVAQKQTGWKLWEDEALVLPIQDDCVRIFNFERNRFEYFGDWGMK